MDILFKNKKGATLIFRCHQNDVNNFCAGDLFHNFMVEPAGRKGVWGDITDNEEPCSEADILKQLILHSNPTTMFFAADRQGGDADRYLFPHCGKTFYMEHPTLCKSGQHLKVETNVSDYYRNRNSGHKVRHMYAITTIEAMSPVANIAAKMKKAVAA